MVVSRIPYSFLVHVASAGSSTPRGGPPFSALLLLALLVSSCASSRPPVDEALRGQEQKTPVVLIPGITGTRLRHPASGRLRWGNGRAVFLPRDGGYDLAVPIGTGLENPLLPDGPVERIRLLGVLRFEFYGALIRLMEENGYRYGDLDRPEPDDTFFVFGYDWRHGNVRAARRLAEQLDTLRQVRGVDTLTVTLIGQSNAGRIARYLKKYGMATLEEAEARSRADDTRQLATGTEIEIGIGIEIEIEIEIEIDKIIFFGADSGGAFAPFRDLNEGRTYLPLLGRRFLPETLFTLASLFESLPLARRDLFFDETGRLLDIDLADAENWRRYGWSVFGRRAERRLAELEAPSRFGTPGERAAYLAETLDRAVRLQGLLARDVADFGKTRYYMIRSDSYDTEDRALLVHDQDGWHTFYGDDRRVRRDPRLLALAIVPGDGHATSTSQEELSEQEREALEETVLVDAPHRRIILHPEARRRLLDFLLD